MNNATPPSPYYDGITFNPFFFVHATTTADAVTGITQAQADVRYLIKGSPDTATAQETFQGGIITSTAAVNKITSTNNNPSLFNDTAATAAYTNVQLVNAQDTQILIGNSQVTAPMDIANGATRTGNLNICNGLSSASTVSICDKGAGQVNMTGFVFTLASIIYNTVATSINLFNTTTGTVSLGAWKFLNQTLNPNNVASAVSICNSNTTGALTIGSNTMTGNISVLSAGSVNIATTAAKATDVNVQTGASTTGNCNIMTGVGSTGGITIGGATTSITMNSNALTLNAPLYAVQMSTANYYSFSAGGAQAITTGDTRVLFPTQNVIGQAITYSAGTFTNSLAIPLTVLGTFSFSITLNATGYRTVYILVGTTRCGELQVSANSSSITVLSGSFTFKLPAGGTFGLLGFQSSGASLTILNAAINPTCIDFIAI